MALDQYRRSFEEFIEVTDEEAEYKLRTIRQQYLRDFITRITQSQQEWESAFKDILERSQENDLEAQKQQKLFNESRKSVTFNETLTIFDLGKPDDQISFSKSDKSSDEPDNSRDFAPDKTPTKSNSSEPSKQVTVENEPPKTAPDGIEDDGDDFCDPQFSNFNLVKEYIRVQQTLENARQSCSEIATNPALKSFKNELNIFIRTQINSISNSDNQHLETKIRSISTLFSGQSVFFQERTVNASQHPQGALFAMDLAAQTFVTVGTRLVNSVPAIARSLATVINGILRGNFPIFKDLFIGHLQERCPFVVPMHPKLKDFKHQPNPDTNYKIACGYAYDAKNQFLETEEKYLARMRSMVLMFACFTIQGHIEQSWSWLAAFLSLKPKPVITATVLQAFLQEASKELSTTYGKQYKKLLSFIKSDYMSMIERATLQSGDRQSLVKLKNLLSDSSNLIAAPSMSSIFAPNR